MKKNIISLIAAGFLVFTPQLFLAAEKGEKQNSKDKAPRDEKAPAEGSGEYGGTQMSLCRNCA